jgi:hypothetical protein
MLSSALILSLLIGATSADSAADRQISAPCPVIREKANQYFTEHHFRTGGIEGDTGAGVSLRLTQDSLTSSGAPLHLNRFSIHRYTLHRHLSPMTSYTDFHLTGQLTLTPVSEASCAASLKFNFSAFEYVWSLAVIDDGYRSNFTSNGTLERGYLDSLAALVADTGGTSR